ncbi:MAG: copper homeostasis protein CutC [Gemmatimonadales bacterium]
MSRIMVEICCENLVDAMAAQAARADRLELAQALELGGLTPSPGLALVVGARVPIPFVAMVRPRGGDFVYQDAEVSVMERDAGLLLEAGAAGIVFGCLTSEGRLDERACARLIAAADDADVVFHRAFDRLKDPFDALETLIDLGVNRVLTSGGARTALEGADRIRMLVERAAGRIEILPGGGIREENVEQLVRRTHCTQVHLSRR